MIRSGQLPLRGALGACCLAAMGAAACTSPSTSTSTYVDDPAEPSRFEPSPPRPSMEQQRELAGVLADDEPGASPVDPPLGRGDLAMDPDAIPRDEDSMSGHAPAQAATLVFECEDFQGEWKTQTNVAGYSGSGFAISAITGAATTTMSREIDVPEDGVYTVWARGFEGGKLDRRWRVEVQGVALAPTHAARNVPDRYTWQRSGVVALHAGPALVAIADVGDSYEVADGVLLTKDPEFNPGLDEVHWNVLHASETRDMLLKEIVARAHEYGERVPAPSSLAAWQARADEVRSKAIRALGLDPLPSSAPLNANVLGFTQMDGYRIERVTFESRPGFIVPANVYVPDGPGPFPLVLSPVGHWGEGKADPTPAAINHALARQGFVTIIYDPFGQGERQLTGNYHDEHWRLALSGHSNMSLMVWSTSRALDYMLSRDEVDTTLPVACTGASGGGLNTLMLSVVEPRIGVSIPVAYVDTYESFMSTKINHCPCSHVPGMASFTDMGELAALFAPKPQLVMHSLGDDMFLPEGVEAAVAQAVPVYGLYQAGANLERRSFGGGHDYGRELRESAYGFLAQHVLQQGDGSPIAEPTIPSLPASSEVYHCFSADNPAPSTLIARDFAREWAEEAAAALPSPDEFVASQVRSSLLEVVHPPADQQPVVEPRDSFEFDGLDVQRLRVEVQPGISLPAHYVSAGPSAPAVVLVDANPGPFAGRDWIRMAHDRGLSVLHIAPRGSGETVWSGHEHELVTSNMLLGDSALGQRAFDIHQAVRVLRLQPDSASAKIGVVALWREAALPALFAQALWPDADAVSVGPVPGTYFNGFEGIAMPTMAYVNRILFAADMPHVLALAAERPLRAQIEGNVYKTQEPAWAAYLQSHADLAGSADAAAALDWVATQLQAL